MSGTAAQESPTPIVDLLRSLPRPDQERATGRFALPFLAFTAWIAISGDSYFILMPQGFLLIVFLTTAIHELGHIIAGWCVGFRFKGIHADPFRLRIDSGRWKFRVRPRLFRGFALMTLDRVRRVRQRLVAVTAGGPLASLLSGITAIVAGELVLVHSNGPGLGAFLDCYGVWSLFIACASLLYLREGHVTDGMILRALLFSRTEAEQFVALTP